MKKIVLLLVLSVILIAPCFGDSYIITPQDKQEMVVSSLSEKEIGCNPIYGTNSCSGELTENEKQILITKGYNIYPNLKVYAFLDESVPQIQADKLWNISVSGTNLTGKGQTVCIIDTGIDYNHPALGGSWGNKVIGGWRFLDGCNITNQSCNCTYNNSACYDYNGGHGTHVAGIVASNNTTYRGVAPDAKLVVIKALNSSGSGWTSDVISGINYCTNFSEEYNISVISMSLGTGSLYDHYCDDITDLGGLSSAVNNATAKNISVVVASGNKGNTTDITAPACLSNATPVGSVNNSNAKSSFSNYWSLPILFAPGENIYSTILTNNWEDKNGTSMSAPHVSGVFALINQYLNLSGKTKIPQELEDMAGDSGYKIGGNENHSRINAYNFYLKISSNNLTTCEEITSSGYYNLTQNVSSSGTCFTIKSNNVTLDCKGYQINYSTTSEGYAINNSGGYANITIKNCGIVQGGGSGNPHAIYFNGVNNGLIQNNIISTSGFGSYPIYLPSSSNINVTDSILNATDEGTKDIRLDRSENIKLINSTYSDITLVESSSLWRYWYLDVNATNSTGDPLNNTNVTITDKFNNSVSKLTNESGCIQRQTLQEYNQTSSNITYFTNYTIHGFHWGTGENTTEINLTESRTITLNLTDKAPTTIATAKTADGENYTFGTWTNSTYVNVTLNCTDYGENCNITLYCNSTDDTCDPNIEYNGTPVQISTEGTSYIRFRSNDTEGHTEKNKTKTIKIDRSPPQITINSPEDNDCLNNRTITINLTVTDDFLNYTNISIYNSTGLVNSTRNQTNGTYTINLSVPEDGNYSINATAYDKTNKSNSSIVPNIIVDIVKPNTTATAKKPDNSEYTFDTWTNSSYITVTLNCNDSGSGCGGTSYCKENNSCVPTTPYIEKVNVSTEGISYIRYYSKDNAGNNETVQNKTIKIDRTPPKITVNSPTNNQYIYTHNITINLTVTDNFLNYTNISIYNSTGNLVNSTRNQTNGTYTITLSVLTDDIYNITATTYDNATNFNSSSVSITVDTTNQTVFPSSINIPLKPEETNTTSFKMMNVSENVSLSITDNYLTYSFGGTIENNTRTNFAFIIPHSSNLTANLSWTNSTNNLTINLTNLRNQSQTYFNSSGSGNQIIDLEVDNISYGIWNATIFGENITGSETFDLTIKLLDNRFKINFTDVKHKFENKKIENRTEKEWSFYVDNSVSSINISLISNAEEDINLSLYNSTDSLVESNKTTNGTETISSTEITEGNWKVKINNTNQTTNFTYNLTIHLSGNNFTKLGNLTSDYSNVTLTVTSPPTEITDGNYTSEISIISHKPTMKIPLTIMSDTPILKLRPNWKENYFIGNQSLSAGETETYNTTRNLFINLNQTKSLLFVVNNTGTSKLENLTISNSSFSELNITISEPRNITAGSSKILDITVFSPNATGNYSGWIYLNSSNGQPFNYLNLTLNLTVTNKTLPRLSSPVYYLESDNSTQINFSVYFFDNQTVDKFWNSSYNLTLVNSTNNSQDLQNLTFDVSNGLFSGMINTTNLTEGKNYTIIYNPTNNILLDDAGNIADINLTFELLNNLNLNVISDLGQIVRGYPFDFEVNVSKLGNLSADNVTVCLELPDEIKNQTPKCVLIGNLTGGEWNQTNFTLNGTQKGTYTINITTYSADGRFNKTKEQNVVVKYGNLVASLGEDTPDSKEVNKSFTVHVDVENTGDWDAFIDKIKIKVCDTVKTADEDETIEDGGSETYSASGFECSSTGDRSIYIRLSDVENATNIYSDFKKIGEITITSPPSDGDGGDGNETPTTNYDLSFEKPTSSTLTINQGGSADLDVKIKNTGDAKLHDLSLKLIGLNSSYYSITPTTERDLSVDSTLNFEIHFSIPEDFEAKDYSLTLKAISDEKNKTKSITLTVYKLSIEFINLTNVTITQGEQLTKKFKIKNIGERKLHNLYPELSGITIIPSAKINLSKNTEKEYEMNFSISKNEEIGVKEKTLKIISDEKNFTKKFNLIILPCEEEKLKIKEDYENLSLEFQSLLEEFEKAKNEGKNISGIESEIINANQTLNQIKDYIEQGKYIEAKTLIDSLPVDLNSLSADLENLEKRKGTSKLLIIVIVIFVVALVGIIVFYTFLPKKGYLPGKGYIAQSRKSNFEDKIRGLFKKFRKGKSEEEKVREQKLSEWRKYYDDLKKKKYGE